MKAENDFISNQPLDFTLDFRNKVESNITYMHTFECKTCQPMSVNHGQ